MIRLARAARSLAGAVLLPGTKSWIAVWGRFVRDAGSEVLPLSQVGGYVLGTRAITLAGSTLSRYASSCASNSSVHGMLTTLALMPSLLSFS